MEEVTLVRLWSVPRNGTVLFLRADTNERVLVSAEQSYEFIVSVSESELADMMAG